MVRFLRLGGPPALPVSGKNIGDPLRSVVEFFLLLAGCPP